MVTNADLVNLKVFVIIMNLELNEDFLSFWLNKVTCLERLTFVDYYFTFLVCICANLNC